MDLDGYHQADEAWSVEDPLVGFDGGHPAVGVVEQRPHHGVDHGRDDGEHCHQREHQSLNLTFLQPSNPGDRQTDRHTHTHTHTQ